MLHHLFSSAPYQQRLPIDVTIFHVNRESGQELMNCSVANKVKKKEKEKNLFLIVFTTSLNGLYIGNYK